MREYSGSLRICHFKEFLLNTTKKISLSPKLSQRDTLYSSRGTNLENDKNYMQSIRIATAYLN